MLLMGFLDIRNTNSVNKAHATRDSIRKVIYPTILSPTIERISVLRKNTRQKVAGS